MADTAPPSIAGPFQGVAAEGEENSRQRAAIQARLDNRTVSVYDDRDNSILQAPIADEQKYRDIGLVVGDTEAAEKQVRNSPLAKVDAFAHHAANSASFGTYDNIAALLGQKEYLKNEAAVTENNPYTSLAGDISGGLLTAEGRGFNRAGVALSAYEGGSAAATNAYALDEPITAERVLKGVGAAVAYNALFNLGPSAVAQGVKGTGKGLHAINGKLRIFLKEGEEAGENLGSATYRPSPRTGGVRASVPPSVELPVVPQTAAEKMGATLQRDPEAVAKDFHENIAEQNRALIVLDGLDHESSAAEKIRQSIAKMEEKGRALEAEMAPEKAGVPLSQAHIPNPEANTGEGVFEYPGATTTSQKVNMWRKSFEDMLGTEENHLADAHRQEFGRLGKTAKAEGRLDDASRHFESKKFIERELAQRLPDRMHPETGDLIPGFTKHIKEYSRLSGNDTSELGSLRYRAATAAEKASIDAEVAAHPDSAAQFRGDEPSQNAHIGDGEPHVPQGGGQRLKDAQEAFEASKQKIEDIKAERVRYGENISESEINRLNRAYDLAQGEHAYNSRVLESLNKAEKPYASNAPLEPDPGNIPEAPGEVNKVSDINGKTPAEQSARAIGQGGPKYMPRWRRSTFWRLNLATFGMAKTLLGSAAAFNEVGPFLLNNSERFAKGVQSLADRSAQGTAGAIRKAISGTVGRRAAAGDSNPKEEFDRHVKTITAGQATPGSLEQGVKHMLGPEAEEYPEFTTQVVAGIGRQLDVGSNLMPRNVQEPTPRGASYTPPRSAMVRFNRAMRAINDPDHVIANPDPDTWAAVQQAHPETAKYVKETLMAVVANPKIKLNKQQARNVSVLLGHAITPQNQPDYLKSNHDLVTLSQASSPPDQTGGKSSGPKSAKTGQQMIALEATPDQQTQLNL